MKFSVIIPVYNVAPYLRECLDSVVSQTYPDWEAICVDDGSTDGSAAILDEYAGRDTRFKVIHQKNSGVSAARNAAMDASIGEWICFLDADDVWSPVLLESVAEAQERYPTADVVRFDKVDFEQNGKVSWSCAHVHIVTSSDISIMLPSSEIGFFFWCKVYKRTLLDSVRFPKIRTGEEDLPFIFMALDKAGMQVHIHEAFYGYRQLKKSASHGCEINESHILGKVESRIAIMRIIESSRKRFDRFTLRAYANGAVEGIPCLIRMLPENERRKVHDEWLSMIESMENFGRISRFQRVRVRIVRRLGKGLMWVEWILCELPAEIKRRGIHR